MTPVWFIALQIPHTLKKTTKRKQSRSDGANDNSDSSGKEVSKKVTNKKKQFKQKSVLTESNLTDKDVNVYDYGSETSLRSNESFDESDWELSDFDEWMP